MIDFIKVFPVMVLGMLVQFLFCTAGIGIHASEIPVEKAIDILKSMERQLTTLKWTCESETGAFSDPNNIEGTYKKSKQFGRQTVLLDVKSGWYCVDSRSITPTTDKSNPFLASRQKMSFDGTIYREWDLSQYGLVIPEKELFGRGVVTFDRNQCQAHHFMADSNFRWQGLDIGVPLYFYDSCAPESERKPELISNVLTRMLQHNKKMVISEHEPGVWKVSVSTVLQVHTAQGTMEGLVHRYFLIDVEKGGIVTQLDVFYTDNQGKENLGGFRRVELQQNHIGQWGPKVVKYTLVGNGSIDTFRFSDFEVNPKVSKKDFAFDFPEGTCVDDYIAKQYYQVGDALSVDKAIDEFMRRHGLTGDIPARTQRGNTLRYILMGAGIILIGIAIFQMIQKRRKE